MSYDEDESLGGDFKASGYSDDGSDEPLDIPEEINDFGLDEEDPDRDG